MAFQTPITIAKALDRIHRHDYVLPAIQREFVWKPQQITRLFDSLMLDYPIGSFLFWSVNKDQSRKWVFYDFIADYHERTGRHLKRLDLGGGQDVTAILDGQQRLTSLNIGLRGSHAEKLPRMWVASNSAYPIKHLYLDLMTKAPENELGMEYDFRFLAPSVAVSRHDSKHWFPVSQILQMDGDKDIFKYVRTHELLENDFAYATLSDLRRLVHERTLINFYEEDTEDLDKVLNIFIRVNSGGVTLSHSDLLLSIATAQWTEVEAREVVHSLVDELNRTGKHFTFNKDLVLKATLLLSDIESVAFKVTNFNVDNMAIIEDGWASIANSLRLAVRLLADFGFSARTLSANSVLLPVAYYLHHRKLSEHYLLSTGDLADREVIRNWTIRSLLKSGIWGSGLDTLLRILRSTIREHGASRFPVEQMDSAMARLGKSLRFDDVDIQNLVSLHIDDRRTFVALALLYPGMDFRHDVHLDHIFPKSLFNRSHLRSSGVADTDHETAIEACNRIPNLQLLEGPINAAKQATLPAIWIESRFPDTSARDAYRIRHDLGELPAELAQFHTFYARREAQLAFRFHELLVSARGGE